MCGRVAYRVWALCVLGAVRVGVLYQGTWVYGKRHGQGSYKYHDGGMYEGEWVDDKVRVIAAANSCRQVQHTRWTHSLIALDPAAGVVRVDSRPGHPRVRDRQQGEPRKRPCPGRARPCCPPAGLRSLAHAHACPLYTLPIAVRRRVEQRQDQWVRQAALR